MWSLMKDIAREMGVRTDIPFWELTEKERDIVFHGTAENAACKSGQKPDYRCAVCA